MRILSLSTSAAALALLAGAAPLAAQGASARDGQIVAQERCAFPYRTLDEWMVDARRRNPQLDEAAFRRRQAHFDYVMTTTEVECLRVQYMSGGHRVTGYIVKPADTAGKKYPVFVFVPAYPPGGRIDFLHLFNFYGRVKGQGVVVVFPAFRGNDGGEGRDEFGGADVDDLVNVSALARGQPYMDADNLFLYGGGRSGMMIYLALIRGMPVRAAAVENAPSDVRAWAAHDTAVLRVLRQANPDFERNPDEHYRARSILDRLDRINTPLLIRHGSGNRRVPVSHALNLAAGLEALGKSYKLVIYPNDDPDIQKNDPEDDRLAHEWLRSHVPGIPPWPSQRLGQPQGTPEPERTPVPAASGRRDDAAVAPDSVQAHRAAMHFLAAFDSLQWEPFRAYLAADVNTFPPSGDRAREGRDAIAGWEQFFREVRANRASRGQPGPPYLDIGRRMRDLRVQLAGEAAVVSFLLGDESPSRRTLVFRRDADGAWRLIHLHASLAPPSTVASSQVPASDTAQVGRAREELRAMYGELNAALQRRDRAALERIFAPEFSWVHAFGYADDRATHLDETLEMDSIRPMRVPSFAPPGQLLVYDSVAVYRYRGGTDLGTPTLSAALYLRRDGRWQILQIQGTEANPERVAVPLDPALLDAIAGRYDQEGVVRVIAREGDALVTRRPGLPRRVLTHVGEMRFFDKVGGEWTFHRGPDGRVTHFVLRIRGRELRGTRIQ